MPDTPDKFGGENQLPVDDHALGQMMDALGDHVHPVTRMLDLEAAGPAVDTASQHLRSMGLTEKAIGDAFTCALGTIQQFKQVVPGDFLYG